MNTLLNTALNLAAVVGTATAQQTVYAIGNGGTSLVRFQSDDPANATIVADFSGDAAFLDAIDFRPATWELYGYLDSADAYFTVNLGTGQLTQVSSTAVGATTNTFQLGMDFNPTIDRLRVVTDSGQNIVYNPNTGTASAFTSLFYGDGDINEGMNAAIIDNAYSQNFAGSTATVQYAIDYGMNTLVTLGNNTGVLATVGELGVDTDIYTGLDIFTDSMGNDTAYAILTGTDGLAGFYTVSLTTGEATYIGDLSSINQIYSLAVIPAPGVVGVLGLGLVSAARRRR